MHRFFIPPEQLLGSDPYLQEDEAKHLLKVLRMKVGDQVILFDNTNQQYQARIASICGGKVHFQILGRQTVIKESPIQITLGLPLIRPQPFEWILQKGTELGVKNFRPFYSAHSRRNFEKAKMESRRKRWQKIIMEASKQCERNVLPELFPTVSFADILEEEQEAVKIIPYEEESSRTLKDFERQPSSLSSVLALIGPEGGFHQDEVQKAQGKGFVPISLGPRTLRSETAALAMICLVQFIWGDMGTERT